MAEEHEDELVIDLDGEPVRPEELERLIRATSALSELRDERYRQPMIVEAREPPWRWALAVVLFLAGLWVLAAPPGWTDPSPRPEIRSEDIERGLRAAMFIQIQAIDAFRLREGHLPEALDDVTFRVDGVHYTRSNNRVFQLVGTGPDGSPVVFDSTRPDPLFAEAAPWAMTVHP